MTHLVLAIQNAILYGTALLYGAVGETLTEKSGNLNLGIPGIMSMGAISGFIGAYFYNQSTKNINGFLAIFIPMICCIIGSLLASLIYVFLTCVIDKSVNVLRDNLCVLLCQVQICVVVNVLVFYLSVLNKKDLK